MKAVIGFRKSYSVYKLGYIFWNLHSIYFMTAYLISWGAKMAGQYKPPPNDPILESRHPKETAERHVESIEYLIFLSQVIE